MKITLSKWACDFCNRTEDEAAHIVTTPSEVAICDECVATCTEIIVEAKKPSGVKVTVSINNVGRPVVETDEDRIAAFSRLAR
ncbi:MULTISPECIES: ClpX C4-type zinc finger protein [Burkholderia cepacia complex]|uniref:ClpX C4-type zinc finger protein n=1 Tax=Burkholderia cepacia complex TaxID=87882 RepID=UPI000F08020D|nr:MULTISPECIES: ClpX C4-type zinc finger protein [Burkholderia cepacia complex]AYQ38312.1 Clp protease [Burkholderia lata]